MHAELISIVFLSLNSSGSYFFAVKHNAYGIYGLSVSQSL